MEWSREKIFKLINIYKNFPVLWNIKHADAKNKVMKNEAWQEIARIFGEDRAEIERKMKNLLSQFNREVKKITDNKHSMSDSGDGTSKWFAYQSLLFLIDRYKPRLTKDEPSETVLLHDEISIETIEGYKFNRNEADKDLQSDCSSEQNDESFSTKPFLPQMKINLPPLKRKLDSRKEEEPSANVTSDYEQQQGKDEYSIFGEYVACKVRKLSSHYARANVQHLINNIIWEAEMGKYDSHPENIS